MKVLNIIYGIITSFVQYAIPYVHERKQFGKPIGTFQLMQGKIAGAIWYQLLMDDTDLNIILC